MATLRLIGTVTADGYLNVELPKDTHFEVGEEIEVSVEIPEPIHDEVFKEILKTDPKTGAEIVAMLEDEEPGFLHVTDSAAWVEEMRRRPNDPYSAKSCL